MSITPIKHARKPFLVDAIQVTTENMVDVNEWCSGTLTNDDPKASENPDAAPQYIKVDVNRPLNERQTKAYPGDWVLELVGSGFKVYTDKAFRKSFDVAKTITKAQADQAGIRPPVERKKKRPVPTAPSQKPLTEKLADSPAGQVLTAVFSNDNKSSQN